MKKVIGILFPSSKSGGVFQYAQSIADSLIKCCDQFDYIIFYQMGEQPKLFFNPKGVKIKYIPLVNEPISPIRKILQFFNLALGGNIFLVRTFYKALKNVNINLLIIPTPFSYNVPFGMPYIVSVPDYMHKYYKFPEYTFKDKLTRDIVYKYYAKRAVLVVADSNQSADDLHKFSLIKKQKIRIIPYIPPSYIYQYKNMDRETITDLLSNYHLPERFIFYPAQFWFQKNHLRLIRALHLIKEKHNLKISLLLVGNSKGNPIYERAYKEVITLIKSLKMTDQVIHLGYVDEKEMVALYKKATALVAPPFQGPTTLLPLEAMVLGTPVVTTNLFEVPKQVGNAGLFFDPSNIEDMADKIYKVWTNEGLRKELIQKGYERAKNITVENYAQKWEEVIKEALSVVKT